MRAAHRRSPARALLLLSLAACTACVAPPTTPTSAPPRSIALLESASEGYATLLRIADSLTTAGAAASGEAAQSAARTIADRIAPLRGEFEDVTVSMSTSELEQTRSLWMRLALSHAAMEELYRSALTLSADPPSTPDEARARAEQLAGTLELAQAPSRWAAERLQTPVPAPTPPTIAT